MAKALLAHMKTLIIAQICWHVSSTPGELGLGKMFLNHVMG